LDHKCFVDEISCADGCAPLDWFLALKQTPTTPVTQKKVSKLPATPYPTKQQQDESSSDDSSSEEEKPAKLPAKGSY